MNLPFPHLGSCCPSGSRMRSVVPRKSSGPKEWRRGYPSDRAHRYATGTARRRRGELIVARKGVESLRRVCPTGDHRGRLKPNHPGLHEPRAVHFLYLAAVVDVFSRRVAAGRWPVTCARACSSTRIDMAITKRRPGDRPRPPRRSRDPVREPGLRPALPRGGHRAGPGLGWRRR